MAPAVGFVGGMFGFGAGAAFTVAGGAAFSGWVAGAAFGGTLLGGLTSKLLTTVALGALSRAMVKEPEQGGGITISSTLSGEQNPETIVLGRYATGGQAICPPYSHGPSNRYLTHVTELCSAPGAQLDRILIGDDWVELGATPHPEYGRPVLGDKYEGHVWVKYYDGTQTTPDPMLRAKYGNHPERPWTAKMIGTGLCYAILTFYYDQEKLPQVPRYRFELIGVPVYDFRKDSSAGGVGPQRLADPSTWAVSHNAIVLAWNVMRGITLPGGDVWGGNILDLRALPMAIWLAAMNACDVPAEGGNGPEPMYRAGLEVALTSEPAAALTELLKAASATIADLGHGWGVTAGAPALPVYSITDPDVLVSAPEEYDPFPSLADSWTAVTATYPDPDRYWETRESPQRIDLAREARATFGRRMATLALPAAPYGAQVQRLTDAWLKDEARDARHTISLPPDAAHVELIDTIAWTSEHNGYTAWTFSVHEIVEDPFTGVRQLSIRVVNAADYVSPPDYLLPSPPAPPAPAPIMVTVDGFGVAPITMVDAASRARHAGIRILWSPALAGLGLRWRIRLAGQTEIILQGTTQDLAAGFVDVFAGVLPQTDYEVRAELIADRRTVPSAWLPVTTDDVRLSQDDLDTHVSDLLAGLEEWLAAAPPEWIGSAEDRFVELRDLIDEAADLALHNLGLATDYTDTSIETEQIARVAGLQALAAEVQTLTAVLNSNNYLANPQFTSGTDGWTMITGAMTAMDRDEASPDPIIATALTPKFIQRTAAGTGAHAIEQVFDIDDWQPGEVFRWRISLAALAVIPTQARFFWLRDDGSQVAGAICPLTIIPGEWTAFSGQEEPPEGATRLRFNLLRGSTAATTGETARLAVADASVVRVDISQQAQLSDLRVALTNLETALTLWQVQAESRLDDAEADLAEERLTRADAVSALAGLISTLGSRLATVEGGKLDASVITNYYTKAQTDGVASNAAAAATTSLKSSLEGAGGSIKAAQDAANAANTLAGGKGKVIVQNATPATADRLVQNLWIDTTGGANTPKRWTGSAWVAVTDKVATDAAAAAAAALAQVATKAEATAVTDLWTGVNTLGEAVADLHSLVEARSLGQDLVLDGVFAQGLTHWPRGTIPLGLFERNLDSATWQYRLIPGPRAWRVTSAEIGKYRGTGLFPVAAGEEIRISCDAARWSVNCVGLRLVLRFFDDTNTQLPPGTGLVITVGTLNNKYQSLAVNGVVPDGAVSAEVYFQSYGSTGTNTNSAFIANIKALRGQEAYASGQLKITSEVSSSGAEATLGFGVRAGFVNTPPADAGFWLRARAGGGSELLAKADAFYLVHGATETTPFAIVGGVTYLAKAMIRDGDIDNAKIGNIIQSNNYIAGAAGWRINKSGAAEFDSVIIRRQLLVDTGTIKPGNLAGLTMHRLEDGPARTFFVMDTGIPITAWEGQKETYLATAGMTVDNLRGNAGANTYWGFDVTILPLTRWTGGQSLRLKIDMWCQGVTSITNPTITWKIYKVT